MGQNQKDKKAGHLWVPEARVSGDKSCSLTSFSWCTQCHFLGSTRGMEGGAQRPRPDPQPRGAGLGPPDWGSGVKRTLFEVKKIKMAFEKSDLFSWISALRACFAKGW